MFSRGKQKQDTSCEVQKSEGGSDLPGGCRQRWVPAGLCYLGGDRLCALSPHPRSTRPQRPRGPAKRSASLMEVKLRHIPVNDSSFMKKEQSNGNLCRIESGKKKKNAGQGSGLLLWIPVDFVPPKFRRPRGNRV